MCKRTEKEVRREIEDCDELLRKVKAAKQKYEEDTDFKINKLKEKIRRNKRELVRQKKNERKGRKRSQEKWKREMEKEKRKESERALREEMVDLRLEHEIEMEKLKAEYEKKIRAVEIQESVSKLVERTVHKEEMETRDKELAHLKTQQTESEQKVSVLQAKVSDLEKTVQDKEKELKTWMTKPRGQKRKRPTVDVAEVEELKERIAEIDDLKKNLKEKNEKVEKLENEVRRANDRVRVAEVDATKANTAKKVLQDEVVMLKSDLQKATASKGSKAE